MWVKGCPYHTQDITVVMCVHTQNITVVMCVGSAGDVRAWYSFQKLT
jgi:hypothetical protein